MDAKLVLVTGATGVLGRELIAQLVALGAQVRGLRRQSTLLGGQSPVEWIEGDLATGVGLERALEGVEIVVHSASSPSYNTYEVDVKGTERLLDHAQHARIAHLIYPSIVGIERIPLPYYQHKLAAEALVSGSGIPWTILRATQFHTLIDARLQAAAGRRVMVLAMDFRFQPVDPAEVAERLIEQIRKGPEGRVHDFAGPEILSLGELARQWLSIRGLRKWIVYRPQMGDVARGYRRGYNTDPEATRGRIRWRHWLERRYGKESTGA
jgi:uncharacterized protein YbjT (DUF2867 family)